ELGTTVFRRGLNFLPAEASARITVPSRVEVFEPPPPPRFFVNYGVVHVTYILRLARHECRA
ncbi:hypothetical protein, partial [Mesorhizobium sp.]|uniref:hypothetical protein n=1 Tax=Mesorhizobium sp. TaxID=1871066 RepID=UPI00257F08D2